MWLYGQNLSIQHASRVRHWSKSGLEKQNLSRTTSSRVARKRVILYTLHRSGSTFTGEFFDHHPQVLYLFEPLQLYPVGIPNKEEISNRLGETLLRSILKCDFGPLIQDVTLSSNQSCTRIRRFAPRLFCTFSGRRLTTEFPKSACNPLNIEKISQKCKKHEALVVKLVSLKNFTSLVPLMQEGVKIVHLVRDPRGEIASINQRQRLRGLDLYWKMSVAQLSTHICEVLREGLKLSTQALKKEPNLRENYRIVRYEDIAKDPLVYVKKLFEYTELNQSETVYTWMHDKNLPQKRKITLSPYTIAWGWRDRINFSDTLTIQSSCSDVLVALGYVPVQSLKHLRDQRQSLHGVPQLSSVWV